MAQVKIDSMINRHDKPYLVIVDDEINFGESLQLALDDTYDVLVTTSVEVARNSFREKFPAVVPIDMRLPDGDGIDVLRELKLYCEMPIVIVMTADATAENVVKALKGGAVDYIIKPFEIGRLKKNIFGHLRKGRPGTLEAR
jgi:DNA-binding response OmpR family regulator